MSFSRKIAAVSAAAAMLLSACGSSATPAPAASGGGGGGGSATGCVVGVSWNNYTEERWAKWDEPAIKKALADAGATYVSNDAKSSAETQATNVTNLITTSKAKVLIILAQDGTAIKASVAAATAAGVPVIAYDRLIEDPAVLYATFDNVEVGRMQAREVFKAVPKGNYAFIMGNKADANADFLRSGQNEIIKAAVDAGDIKNVGETYTNDWKPELAKTEMEQFLTKNSNKIDAVLSENDGMAGGVIAALHDQGLDGKVAVSGQDGDQAALNRVALGTQTVDVWKDSRQLGKTAGDAAVEMCKGTKVDKITGAAPFKTPGGNTLNSILLKADPITKANLKDVLDAGWITKDALCKDVKAGSVDVCG